MAWRTRRAKQPESLFDEVHHLSGKPQEAISLYRAIDALCMNLLPGAVAKRYLKKTVNYEHGNRCFCSVHVLRAGLRVWLRLKYCHLGSPPSFARDVSNIGHWGAGDLELRISDRLDLDASAELIRQSFEADRA